jgi:hypothetical protein
MDLGAKPGEAEKTKELTTNAVVAGSDQQEKTNAKAVATKEGSEAVSKEAASISEAEAKRRAKTEEK